MNVSRGLASLLLLLGAILALALSRPSAATPDPQLPPADRPAGVLTTTTPTLVATDTPTEVATPTATATEVLTATATPLPATATATVTRTFTPSATPTPPAYCGPGWQPVPAPNIGPLTGVDATGPNDVWAVGLAGVLHWDGTAWSQVTAPPGNYSSVAAVAANDVWLGGNTISQTLTVHWDGQAWTVVPSPSPPPPGYPNVTAMTAVAANDVWAAGGSLGGGQAFTLHWDGTSWTMAAFGPPLREDSAVDLASTAADNVWAITYSWYAGLAQVGYWNGQSWGRRIFLNFGDDIPVTGITTTAPNDAWVVAQHDAMNQPSPLYHWNGITWTQIAHPPAGYLWDVDAWSADNAWAVGDVHTLHWNGSNWQFVPRVPGPTLRKVKMVGPNDVWAVGSNNNTSWIEHYLDPPRFMDVPISQPFYPYIQWMGCRSYISGYTCGGPGEPCPGAYFRPGANVTRGQLLKMVVNAAGWLVSTPTVPTFADVPDSHPFYPFIETGVSHGIISGYDCGGPGEPCDPQNRPYFRAGNDITRGQLSKVIALARGYALPSPATPTFADVPDSHPFYGFVEAMAAHNIVSGYDCGGVGEPCDPANRPYFRPAADATRGQVSKFVTLAYGGP
jgi:hypothetical protein